MKKEESLHLLTFNINRYLFLLFLTVGVFRSIVTFLLSVSVGEFYQLCFQVGGARARLLERIGINIETMNGFFVFFGALVFIKMLSDFSENYLLNKAAEQSVQKIREHIFKIQINWPADIFSRRHFGKYLLRYSNDMKAIQNYISRGIFGGSKDGLFLLIGATILYFINAELAGIYLGLMAFAVLVIIYISKYQIPLIERSRNKRNQLLAFVTKSFQRHARIKFTQTESKAIERFNKNSEELRILNLKNHRFDSLLLTLFTFLQYGIIIVLLYKIYMIQDSYPEKVDIGSALVFLLIVLQINPTMKRIMKVPSTLNKGKVSLKKIRQIRPVATESTSAN